MRKEINVIIYRLGVEQILLESKLLDKVNVLAYTDSFSKIERYNNRRFVKLDNLREFNYDYILIAIEDEGIRKKVVSDLVANGCNFNKIVDLYRISKVDRVMLNTENVWEGIVLGISYGDAGINTTCFRKRICNLAVPGLDIYGNYMTVKKCLEKYRDKMDLKYCIFDMFDYSYFAYDMSLSKEIRVNLLHRGGEKTTHNIGENKHIEKAEKDFLINYCRFNNDTMIYKSLFKEIDYWGSIIGHKEDAEWKIENIIQRNVA